MHVLTQNFELVVLIQQWVERVNESKRQVSKELKSWTMRLFFEYTEERKNEGSDRLKPQGMLCYE